MKIPERMKNIVILVLCLCLGILSKAQDLNRAKLDSLIAIANNSHSDSEHITALNQITTSYWYVGSPAVKDSFLYYAKLAVREAKKSTYKLGYAEALFNYGRYHVSASNRMVEATPSFLESLAVFEELNDSTGISRCYVQLGVVNFSMQNYEVAIEKHKLALRYKDNITSKYLLAICYSELDSVKQAKTYFQLAIQDYTKQKNHDRLIECFMYLGRMFVKTNQLDSGFYYLNKSVALLKTSDDALKRGRPYAFLATAYLKSNDLKNAIFYAHKSYVDGKNNLDDINVAESLHVLAQASALQGNYKNAFQYLNELYDLKNNSLSGSIKQKIADMQSQFAYDKEMNEQKIRQEKDREFAQQQINQQKNLRNAFIISAVLLLLSLALLYSRFQLKRNANLELEVKNEMISNEKDRSDKLLLNILPTEIADELKRTGESAARQYEHVTVLFTDFVNFTGISEKMKPTDLVQVVHKYFTAFDAIMDKYGLEKIKTIGDAYLAVCGLPLEVEDHAIRVAKAALEIQQLTLQKDSQFQIRIGIHSGPVVAGIVGVKKYAYDIWGDTVNTAARMEQHSETSKINMSGATFELVKDAFHCAYRGKIEAKNKGQIDMYFLDSVKV